MNQTVYLSRYSPTANGESNDFEALHRCFSAACEGDTVVVEPGTYLVDSARSIPLCSHLRVVADGAVFRFPRSLGDCEHRMMFLGEDISHLNWQGGCFEGYVYNPLSAINAWEPSACTKGICVLGSEKGGVSDIRISGVTSNGVAGSAITVYGWTDEQSRRVPAKNIDVVNCNLTNTGKFMWDYGYLWQRIVFPEYHTAEEISNAYRYMPPSLISGEISFSASGEILVDHMPEGIKGEASTVSFFGQVPAELKRGNCYFIVEERAAGEHATMIRIAEQPMGDAIRFSSNPKGACRLFRNLFTVHHNLYAPAGCGTGKGPLDLSVCDNVHVSGCRMNASGDSMHIHRSHNVVFTGNQITGSRMGAFFIAQFCKNVAICGNTVLGTNGSRVLSIEKSTEDITVTGNTFTGGGRGCWINQPYNLIMTDNIFRQNTNKCTPRPDVGRMTPNSGSYERYPEIYFTTWEENATYGAVIMRSNIIESTPYCSAAVAFHDGGKNLIFESNILLGQNREVYVGKKCEMPHMSGNIGVERVIDTIGVERFDQ